MPLSSKACVLLLTLAGPNRGKASVPVECDGDSEGDSKTTTFDEQDLLLSLPELICIFCLFDFRIEGRHWEAKTCSCKDALKRHVHSLQADAFRAHPLLTWNSISPHVHSCLLEYRSTCT
jgi:hypothetical protein